MTQHIALLKTREFRRDIVIGGFCADDEERKYQKICQMFSWTTPSQAIAAGFVVRSISEKLGEVLLTRVMAGYEGRLFPLRVE